MTPKRYTRRQPPVLLLGTIAASGLMLSACGDDPPQNVLFNSVEQCVQAGYNNDICNAEFREAVQQHNRDAPHFNGQAACEAELGAGKCTQVTDTSSGGTGSFWVPFMTGYVVSSALQSLTNIGAYNSYRRDYGYYPTPIYYGRGGSTYYSPRREIGQPAAPPRPYNVNTRTVSRQGFGGASRSRGFSFGG